MKSILIGCGEWGFRDLPLQRHFEIARQFGFRHLEFGIGGDRVGRLSETPTDAEIGDFRLLGQQFGIKTSCCCIENDFTLPGAPAHDAMVGKVLSQMRAAARCGATHVRLFAGFTPLSEMTEDRWGRMLSAIRACDELGRELGLTIALETHGAITSNSDGSATHLPTVTTDSGAIARLLRDLPSGVCFNYDPGNIKAAEGSNGRLHLELLNDRINYCHLKDWRRAGKGWQACAIGDDDLDYATLLPRMQYTGVYLIEYEPLEDTVDGIQRSLDYLAGIVPQIVFE